MFGASVIEWLLDLQLLLQLGPITTNVGSNPAHGEVYLIQHYVIKFVSDRSVFLSGYPSFLHQ
jgi:hypothetical protein